MKNYPWIFLSAGLLAAAFVPQACGGGNSGGGGSATTTATGTTTTSHSSTGTGTGTGTGGSGGGIVDGPSACDAPDTSPSNGSCYTVPPPPDPPTCPHPGVDGGTGDAGSCDGLLGANPNECTTCALGACCDELQACKANADCWACLTDPNVPTDDPKCVAAAVKTLFDSINTCAGGCCTSTCYQAPDPGCNPVTNAPCDAANGEACDTLDNGATFQCLPGDALLCYACDDAAGPWCAPGMHCVPSAAGETAGNCGHYCCDDGDCGAGKCDKTILGSTSVGLCVKK